MRDGENIQELVKLAPEYIGFIFYDKSKRFVADFPKVAIPSTIKKVGVFVNEPKAIVLELVKNNKLDAVQLHGGESVEYCKELARSATSSGDDKSHHVKIIKAFSVDKYFDFSTTKNYEQHCDLFIFDTKGEGYGGTGLKYDWTILSNYKGKIPFLLSGGIGPDDVKAILSFLSKQESSQCIGVDLNSAFEDIYGLKNIEKLKEFIEEIN